MAIPLRTNILQGSVATHLRGGGIFHYNFTANILLSLRRDIVVMELVVSTKLLYVEPS